MQTVEIEVARGRTVIRDGKPFGPGTLLTLPQDEARWLLSTGHVLKPGDAQPVPGNIIRPIGRAELDRLPPGPVPLARGMAVGPKVFT